MSNSIAKIWKEQTTLGFFWLALAMFLARTGGGAQAQLLIDIYPSQDDPTKTLWIFDFMGSGTAPFYGSTIRGGGNDFHRRDSWKIDLDASFYANNKPTNQLISISPLFSSTNHQRDIDSITRRLQGAPSFGPLSPNRILFSSVNVTNSPTIRIGNTDKNIGWIFMNDADNDEIGIRGTPPNNLAFTNGQTSLWFGAGILDKPIEDFLSGNEFPTAAEHGVPYYSRSFQTGAPYFAENIANSIQISVHALVIPEPAEYALVFGLFALGFFVFRHFQKKTKKGGGDYGTHA